MSNPSRPLQGLRVLECASFIAGPMTAMLLADWGAEVVKLEPLQGELARQVGPGADAGMTPVFAAANRGKRSVCADLRSEEGRALSAALAARADVIVHNVQPRIAEKLGLTLEVNPSAVICAISAFGPVGPYANKPLLDSLVQAMTGMASLTGVPDGEPMRAGSQVVDVGTGVLGAAATLAALIGRGTSGVGREVDVALFEIGLLYSGSFFPLRCMTDTPVPRLGNRSHPILADQFAAADGWVVLAVWEEARWAELCRLLGHPEWLANEAWTSNAGRLTDYQTLQPAMAEAIATWPARELRAKLQEIHVPAAITLELDEVVRDPHIVQSGALYREERLPAAVDLVVGPVRFDGERPAVRELPPPPLLGAHTEAVLADWGISSKGSASADR